MYVIIITHLNINVGHLHITLLLQLFYGPLSRTIRMSRYQKNIHPLTYPDHHPIFISLFHILRSIASSLFNLHAFMLDNLFLHNSLQVLFGLPLGLQPSTSYSIHFFTQSVSSFCNTCPYHCSLFCGTFMFYLNITHPSDHSHLCSLKFHLVFFHDRPGLTST